MTDKTVTHVLTKCTGVTQIRSESLGTHKSNTDLLIRSGNLGGELVGITTDDCHGLRTIVYKIKPITQIALSRLFTWHLFFSRNCVLPTRFFPNSSHIFLLNICLSDSLDRLYNSIVDTMWSLRCLIDEIIQQTLIKLQYNWEMMHWYNYVLIRLNYNIVSD